MKNKARISRRQWIKGAFGGAAVIASSGLPKAMAQVSSVAPAQAGSDGDFLLVNGKFVDGRGVIASTLFIKNGRIAKATQSTLSVPGATTIDLGGRTVIPGLFDAHVHYTRAGINPGYEARRIERAFSIAELQEAIAKRAESVPAGAFITCIGGWNHTQFAENRRPTKSDLDAAAPKHAVYISGTGGATGAITNSLGRAFLTGKGVMVDEATGVVMSAPAAVAALQSVQTPDDKLRGTADLNRHANSLCLTGVINAGNFEDQELALRLWREDKLTIRMRPLFPADSPQD